MEAASTTVGEARSGAGCSAHLRQSCDAHLVPNDGKSRAPVRSHLPPGRLGVCCFADFLGGDSDSLEKNLQLFDFRRVAHWLVSVRAVRAGNFLDELAEGERSYGVKSRFAVLRGIGV